METDTEYCAAFDLCSVQMPLIALRLAFQMRDIGSPKAGHVIGEDAAQPILARRELVLDESRRYFERARTPVRIVTLPAGSDAHVRPVDPDQIVRTAEF